MCGRYTQLLTLEALSLRFQALLPDGPGLPAGPRYNIAPTQVAGVVTRGADGARRLEPMRWGLVPSWAKDDSGAARAINARGETLTEKPTFRGPFQRSRCLVPADGFYEWKREGRARLPLRMTPRSGAPFAMAGLWDAWKSPDGRELRSFTIITVEANGPLSALHDRMPAILAPEAEAAWLDPSARAAQLRPLLKPLADDALVLTPVSSRVNSAGHEGPDCLVPDPPEPQTPSFL